MATNNTVQITFNGTVDDSVSVAAGGSDTSDTATLNSAGDAHGFFIQCKADNDGTPASGDEVEVYLNAGADPDNDGTTDFDSDGQGQLLMVLNTDEQDPAIRSTIKYGPLPDEAQLYFSNTSGGRAITVSAVIIEQYQS